AHGIQGARREEQASINAAQQRNQHDRADNRVAVRAKNARSGGAEGESVADDFIHGQDIGDGGAEKKIDRDDRKDAAEDGTRNVAAGVFDFFTEIDDSIPAIHGVDDLLQGQHESGSEKPSGREWQRRACGHRGGVGAAAKREASDDEYEKGAGLERGGEQLRCTAPFDAAPLQNGEAKQNDDGDRRISAGESGKKNSRVITNDQRDDGVGAAGGDPVAPADDEAGVFAERAARIVILATAARNRSTEFSERRGAEKGVEAPDYPDGEKQPDIRQLGGDVALCGNDSGGDGVADRGGDAEPHSQDLQQPAARRAS